MGAGLVMGGSTLRKSKPKGLPPSVARCQGAHSGMEGFLEEVEREPWTGFEGEDARVGQGWTGLSGGL